MGFKRGGVTLTWSERHELHGLEIVMRRQPLAEFVDQWMDDAGLADWDDLTRKERAERTRRNAENLAMLIESWNLEDEGGRLVELPPRDGTEKADRRRADIVLQHCDVAMINAMSTAHANATTSVPPPLPESSEPGSTGPTEPEPAEDWGPLQEPISS
jgi:hypothetical protein